MHKWLWLSVLVIVLDQLTKYWASQALQLHEPVAVLPFFNFTLMHNTGAAFSFLNQAGGWQRWFFITIALIVSTVIVLWIRRLPATERWMALALSLIAGGALGNVWDRIQHGYVVDFIDLYYQNWHWPAFNVADSAITVGAVMLVLESFKGSKVFRKQD
ncbi:MAG TPA: signal peptidase II [Gammaproteobacteria bacterium]|nr:signal peptidase II [Gammaproteobacteria bacterium]